MHVKELFDLTNNVAIVTGGGRGLGFQIAEGLAEAGADVVLCSRNFEVCQEAAGRLEEKGVRAIAVACDVTDPDQVNNLVDQTLRTFGRIDILVNNSGAFWEAPAEDMPLKTWHKVMDVNVTGTYLVSKAVGKIMLEQKSGKIINIASVAGLTGTDPLFMDSIGSTSNKGDIISFTKDLSLRWGARGVHVNALAPGFFPAKMSQMMVERGGHDMLKHTSLQRFGNGTDLKGTVLFLASRASDYITGAILPVDGGMTTV